MPDETWHYRAFTAEEHHGRIARARQLMAENGLAACVWRLDALRVATHRCEACRENRRESS